MHKTPRVNAFCWVELAENNTSVAKKFYQGLLGWTYHEETSDMGIYIKAMIGNDDVGAMYAMPDDMKKMHIPPHWASYILVDSCDETTKKAASLGASVIKQPFDVMDAGRMAVLRDPTGAVFMLWEKNKVSGATAPGDKQGAFCWHELLVADPKAAASFYTKTFGWTAKESKFDGKSYFSLTHSDGQPAGGLMELPSEHIPPHWGVYFTVNDIEAAMNYVKNNSGTVFFGPHDVEKMGQFAACADPDGAAFSVFEFKNL
jgi:predicted enzyme related to lactoylglutathione lyase